MQGRGRLVRGKIEGRLGQNVARIEPGIHLHDGNAATGIASEQRRLDR